MLRRLASHHVERRVAQKVLGVPLVFQERQDFASERVVAHTRLVQQRGAGGDVRGQRRIVDAFDLLPTLGRHRSFPLSRTSTPCRATVILYNP